MRQFLVVVGCVCFIVTVELLLSLFEPHRLPPELGARIGGLGGALSAILIPALFIFLPPQAGQQRSLGFRVCLAVLMSWWAALVFRMSFTLPALKQLSRQGGDPTYDGIAGNVGVLLGGCVGMSKVGSQDTANCFQ